MRTARLLTVVLAAAGAAAGCSGSSTESVGPVESPDATARAEDEGRGGGPAAVKVRAPESATATAPSGAPPVAPDALKEVPMDAMHERLAELLGDDPARAEEAHKALVAAGAAAIPALRDGLARALPGGTQWSRVVHTAAAIKDPAAAAVLRAAAKTPGDRDTALLLAETRRPEDLKLALELPGLAESVAAMSSDAAVRSRLLALVDAYVGAFKDVKGDVARARKGASGPFASFLAEIELRALKKKSTGWPAPAEKHPGSLAPDETPDELDGPVR